MISKRLEARLQDDFSRNLLRGALAAQAYMDGTFVVQRGTIADFVDLVAQHQASAAWQRWAAFGPVFRQERQSKKAS